MKISKKELSSLIKEQQQIISEQMETAGVIMKILNMNGAKELIIKCGNKETEIKPSNKTDFLITGNSTNNSKKLAIQINKSDKESILLFEPFKILKYPADNDGVLKLSCSDTMNMQKK
jgi:BRCT domain type II-containing protein